MHGNFCFCHVESSEWWYVLLVSNKRSKKYTQKKLTFKSTWHQLLVSGTIHFPDYNQKQNVVKGMSFFCDPIFQIFLLTDVKILTRITSKDSRKVEKRDNSSKNQQPGLHFVSLQNKQQIIMHLVIKNVSLKEQLQLVL